MENPNKTVVKAVDLPGTAFIIGVFTLIILCAGSPDLLDAIITRVMNK